MMHLATSMQAGLRFSVEEEFCIINYAVSGSMSRSEASYQRIILAIYALYQKAFDKLTGSQRTPERLKAIGLRMWKHTRHAAWMSSWDLVEKSIVLANRCGVPEPLDDSKSFQMLCRLNPFFAVMLREYLARIRRKPGSYWY